VCVQLDLSSVLGQGSENMPLFCSSLPVLLLTNWHDTILRLWSELDSRRQCTACAHLCPPMHDHHHNIHLRVLPVLAAQPMHCRLIEESMMQHSPWSGLLSTRSHLRWHTCWSPPSWCSSSSSGCASQHSLMAPQQQSWWNQVSSMQCFSALRVPEY